MPDPDVLSSLGLPGLFVATFLAGSVVPFPSDAVLAGLVYGGVPVVTAIAVATAGNTLGAVTVLALGRLLARGEAGGPVGRWLARRAAGDPARLARARARLDRFGAPALLLSWVPIAGDVLVLAAGLARIPWGRALAFVVAGKAARFAAIGASALAAGAS